MNGHFKKYISVYVCNNSIYSLLIMFHSLKFTDILLKYIYGQKNRNLIRNFLSEFQLDKLVSLE